MRIAPEGWPFLAVTGSAAAVALVAGWRLGGGWWPAAGLLVAVAAWTAAFFRDPIRPGPRGGHLVLAPADGRVVSVVAVDEPLYVGGRAHRVSIFLNIFDVHVNRYPVSGTVELYRYHPGRFLNAATDKASLDNEQASLGIRTERGPVLVRQIAGLVARRIVTDHREGIQVEQGDRMGLIRFGSRVDVFLAPDVRVVVRRGDRARAGVTVIAQWPQ